MLIWITVYPLLTLLDRASGVACPEGCLCANNLIVCTCAGMEQYQTNGGGGGDQPIVLSSFRGIEYISKIYIHSCRRLTIANDTFNGLDVGHEMTIMNVENLHIQPYAFRKMLKYPNRMTIKDSGVSELAENAFAGFTRTNHLWLKNVTVATVRKGAFGHVSHVEYVYIRESTLGVVEPEAFAFMTSVVHFYVRGKVKIDRLGDHLFRQSSIANITFEEVFVNTTSPRAFSGASYFGQMQFQNCTLLNSNTNYEGDDNIDELYETRNGQKLEFFKTNIEEISLSDFANVQYVRFEETKFDRILPSPSFVRQKAKNLTVTNISRLYFVRSIIEHIMPNSLAYANQVQSVMFDDCAIASVDSRAFYGTNNIDYVVFINSRVEKFRTNSFENVHVENFILDGCEFEMIETNAFRNSKFVSFKIISNHFELINDSAFAGIQCQFAGIESNKFADLRRTVFDEIRCQLVNITDNTVTKISDETFRGPFSIGRINMNVNKFPCECRRSMPRLEIAALDSDTALQRQEEPFFNVNHNLCWSRPYDRTNLVTASLSNFRNSCSTNSSAKLPNFETIGRSLTCHTTLFWTSCRCRRENANKILIVDEKLINELIIQKTSGLTLADCERIRFRANSFKNSSFSRLVINECRHIEFENGALATNSPLFRSLTVRNSNISHLPADLFVQPPELNIDFIEFRNCTINAANSYVFRNSRVGEIRFIACRVGEFAPKFVAESTVTNFTIRDSIVGRINSYAFNDTVVSSLRFSRTRFTDIARDVAPTEFYKSTFVCLLANQFACGCDVVGAGAMLATNGCDDVENVCGDFSGAGYGASYVNRRLSEIFKMDSNSGRKSFVENRRCYVEQTSPSQKRAVHLVSPISGGSGGGGGGGGSASSVFSKSCIFKLLTTALFTSSSLIYFTLFWNMS